MNITVVGSSNVDLIMKVPHLPAPGETVTDGSFLQVFGGKGANQAVAAARLGGQVQFVTCLGNDPFATVMRNSFEQEGLGLDYAAFTSERPTGTALIQIDAAGMNSIAVAPGANDLLTPEHLRKHRQAIAQAKIVLLQMEIPVETNLAAIEIARECGAPVMLNYAPVRAVDHRLLQGIDYLLLNETETAALTDLPSIENRDQQIEASILLHKFGAKTVVLTLGKLGVFWSDCRTTGYRPAFKVDAIDTTAAGDAFCGALAVAILEGMPLDRSMDFASAVSAVSVTKTGAQTSLPSRAEVEAFLRSQGS